MTAIERVRDALTSRGSRIESDSRDRFVAQCPSHDDGRPSLSVRQGDRGVLLYCFAGCSQKDIAADLGLQVQDLFDVDRIDYRYQDRSGKVVRTVTRTPDKDFPQSGKRKWAKGTAPLYRLPEVVQAVKDGRPVYLAEGEKDVEQLVLSGVTATTTAAGASQPHFTDLEPLRGAEVRLVPDQDPEGQKYASKMTDLLAGIADSVTVWQVKAGKDFSDHYAAGFGLEDLEEVKVLTTSEHYDREEEPEETEETARRVVLLTASQVRPKAVHWLWEGRLPKGALSLLAGREGLGKSTLCVWLAAQITRGLLPGQSYGTPSAVVWVTTEDDYAYNVVPRLMAAGADLERVHFMHIELPTGGEVPPVLPLDLAKVEAAMRPTGASLLVVDPLVSVLDGRLDSHKDHSVRQALDPISKLARESGIAVLGITHVGKSKQGDFADRVLGSRGFTGAARSVLALIRDPEDPEEKRLCLGVQKSNYGDRTGVPTLALEVAPASVQVDGGDVASVGKVVILGETSRSVADLLADSDDPQDREEGDDSEQWLRSYLEDRGGEAAVAAIQKDCRKDGISYDVLKKRKKRLGVKSEKSGLTGGWFWSLPEAQTEEGPSAGKVADLQDDREESRPPTPDLCEVNECSSAGVQVVPLDGKRWNLCTPHATDPALPFTLGGQRALMEGETA